MVIYTIGFTKKTAEQFFETLRKSGAKRIVDVRLYNESQLAGFAKKEDLAYFLRKICRMDYVHLPSLAPTPDLLESIRSREITWDEYERRFLSLIRRRKIERRTPRRLISDGCLLCSEHKPDRCHRRLVAEYLQERWSGVEIVHLG